MTLLIAFLLLNMTEASVWAYIGTVIVWLLHVSYHESKR
jgi:hypothetical protein